jgi:ubiquinol-cytochrome c chaperone
MQAYDRGFAMGAAELELAVRRNVYGTATPRDDQVRGMAAYLRAIRPAFVQASFEELCAGRVMARLPEPPASLEAADAAR